MTEFSGLVGIFHLNWKEALLTRGLGLDGSTSMRFATRSFARSATCHRRLLILGSSEVTNQISMVEMFAPPLALYTLGETVRLKRLLVFVDSEAVEGALVRGSSARSDMCLLTGAFWHLCATEEICVYIDRVPTDSHITDGPSRGSCTNLVERGALGIEGAIPTLLRESSMWLSALQTSSHSDTWCL